VLYFGYKVTDKSVKMEKEISPPNFFEMLVILASVTVTAAKENSLTHAACGEGFFYFFCNIHISGRSLSLEADLHSMLTAVLPKSRSSRELRFQRFCQTRMHVLHMALITASFSC
jgi:hypothetical protein